MSTTGKKTIKNTNVWRLNNMLLNNQQITEEIKICIEMNENENTTIQNLWVTVKAVLRGKFIVIQAYLKKQEKSQINNLTLYLKRHWLNGREPEWTPGVGDGQGGLACCDSWVWKSQTRLSYWTELNWTEETNYRTIALISNASKVMLKILQARFKQYMNCELPDVQAGFRKGEEPEIKLPASERVPEKHLFLLYWLCQSLWLCGSQ